MVFLISNLLTFKLGTDSADPGFAEAATIHRISDLNRAAGRCVYTKNGPQDSSGNDAFISNKRVHGRIFECTQTQSTIRIHLGCAGDMVQVSDSETNRFELYFEFQTS